MKPARFSLPLLLLTALACAQTLSAYSDDEEWLDRRQNILEYRKKVRAQREAARKDDNFFVGVNPSVDTRSNGNDADTSVDESAPSIGFSVGFRKHFLSKLGIKIGSQLHFGATSLTISTRDVSQDSYYGYPGYSDGAGGTTYSINNTAQMIIGPFGRFAIEPGIGTTWGGHSRDSLYVSGSAGDFNYPLEKHFSALNGILGGSLFMGSRDEYNLALSLMLGHNTYRNEDNFQFQFTLAATYSFGSLARKG